MSEPESQSAAPEPNRPGFQYSLTTLLLLFVVLASSLAVFGPCGILFFAFAIVLAVYGHWRGSWPLAFAAVCLFCLICVIPAVHSARESARRASCIGLHLGMISMALLNYHAVNGCYPPAYIADKNGKPMHSWRVLILPYLGQNALYNAYDFNEPWDSPKNQAVLRSRPEYYACPSSPESDAGGAMRTNYVAVLGRNAAWAGAKPRKESDFSGVMTRTIMLVEVADCGPAWTEPRDLSLDDLAADHGNSPRLTISSYHYRPDEFFYIYDRSWAANVATADCSVHYFPSGALSAGHLRKVLQIGGYDESELNSPDIAPAIGGRRPNWPNIAALAVWFLSVGVLLYRAVRSRKARQGSSLAATSDRT
jgi:hypothetical protein